MRQIERPNNYKFGKTENEEPRTIKKLRLTTSSIFKLRYDINTLGEKHQLPRTLCDGLHWNDLLTF